MTYRQRRSDAGLCPICGDTAGDLVHCRPCLTKHSDTCRRLYGRRVSNGLCADCQKPRGKDGTSARCRKCADRNAVMQRIRRQTNGDGPPVAFAGPVRPRRRRQTRKPARRRIRKCGQSECKGLADRGAFCKKHRCQYPGCVAVKATPDPRAKWCARHREFMVRQRQAENNRRLRRLLRKTTATVRDPDGFDPHFAAISMLAGKDPFR